MARKKIIFVIVEGISDDEALGVILSRYFSNDTVYLHIMHCDITSEYNVNANNIIKKIGNAVRGYAGRIFKSKDFERIIHISDTDGAFVPDENVVTDTVVNKTMYSVNEIRTRYKEEIEARNHRKKNNLALLSSTSEIWNIPYEIYYMSCNLDHVLYGKLNSTDDMKKKDSQNFAKKYIDDISGFVRFISESDFSVIDNYSSSWKYISTGLHSLERHSNLGLCFKSPDVKISSSDK